MQDIRFSKREDNTLVLWIPQKNWEIGGIILQKSETKEGQDSQPIKAMTLMIKVTRRTAIHDNLISTPHPYA